ncbi:MAG: YkgJ family cysteine cluster protein, partial [Deltaproteobacteria bacterium]
MNSDAIGHTFHSLLAEVDKAFAAMKQQFPGEVRCAPGCDDCCHAVFSVSLVEAWFIEQYFRRHLLAENPALFEEISERAEDFNRERERREQELPLAGNGLAASEKFGQWRIRCPMLDDDRRCAIYELRPLTCRAYGLPLSINGRGHVCG